MGKTTIKTKIQLHSCDIENIDTFLKEKLDNIYLGKCTKKYGYIIDYAIVDYKVDVLSRITCYPICNVTLFLWYRKPKIDKLFRNSKIINISNMLISTKSHDLIDIIVIKSNLEKKGFTYDKNTWKSKNQVLKIGGEIDIKITKMKYDVDNYLCVGELF